MGTQKVPELIFHSINTPTMRMNSIKMGLLMAAGFIAYFLVLYALGYGHLTEFRVFNGIIQHGTPCIVCL
jgi:hypothetical protein